MRKHARLASSFVLFSSLGVAGCAQVLDIPSDPAVVATGPWRCLQAPPQVPTASGPMAQVRVQACDFVTNCTTSVPNLTARLCDKRDVGCNNPRKIDITDDANGQFLLQVPTAGTGFDGFLFVSTPVAPCTDTDTFGVSGSKLLCGFLPNCDQTAPDANCYVPVYSPAMLFFNPPIVRDVDQPIPLQLFPSAALPAVLAAAGSVHIDSTMGNVIIGAVDCDGKPAAGVSFRLLDHSDPVQTLYLKSGVVSDTATQTDSSGVGGMIAIPPGFQQIEAVNSDSVVVGTIGVQVAPSVLTYAALVPSAAP